MGNAENILIVATSHEILGSTNRETGFHLEELSTPYYAFQGAGLDVTIASIKGGRPPHDPNSVKDDETERPESVKRFFDDEQALGKLGNTPPLASLNLDEYVGIYLPGGHGTMWDFAIDQFLADAIRQIYESDRIVAAVCHGPAGLVNVKTTDGTPLVKGKTLSCFTNQEEKAVDLADAVPFLLESKLVELGATIQKADKFKPCVTRDGNLITGQNPASVGLLADQVLKLVREKSTSKVA